VVKIYTRTGDKGETSLFGGNRVSKNNPRIEAYGTIDELNSHLGLCRAAKLPAPIDAQLDRVQSDLFDAGAYLAAPGSDRFSSVHPDRTADLERAIDEMESTLQPLKAFIVPGGSEAASRLHVARTVCRRAERRVIALDDDSEEMLTTIAYLNRLSDFLFVAARRVNQSQGVPDTPWSSLDGGGTPRRSR
jgi:cob(I)alamin adenosyltransferase